LRAPGSYASFLLYPPPAGIYTLPYTTLFRSEEFYVKTAEFPAEFMTEQPEAMITTSTRHQELATGFPVGKRFKSARVQRSCDANFIHLGHEARADGRWRVYVFADRAAPTGSATAPTASATAPTGGVSKVEALASWLESEPSSPLVAYRREGEALDALIELSVIYQQEHTEF